MFPMDWTQTGQYALLLVSKQIKVAQNARRRKKGEPVGDACSSDNCTGKWKTQDKNYS